MQPSPCKQLPLNDSMYWTDKRLVHRDRRLIKLDCCLPPVDGSTSPTTKEISTKHTQRTRRRQDKHDFSAVTPVLWWRLFTCMTARCFFQFLQACIRTKLNCIKNVNLSKKENPSGWVQVKKQQHHASLTGTRQAREV